MGAPRIGQLALLAVVVLALLAPAARAACRVLIVSGDPGADPAWAHQFDDWRTRWQKMLTTTYGVPAANVTVLRQADPAAPDAATRDHVLAALKELTHTATADDQVVLVFIAHAYHARGDTAKLCLPGPHLSDADIATALHNMPAGRLITIILAPDTELFAKSLRGPNRITILADTKPSAPYFCEFLLRALEPGHGTVLEAFNNASLQTTRWYQNQFVGDDGVVTVHGKDFQELFHRFYPDRAMTPGQDQPQAADNNPEHIDQWNGRRIVPEVAGLDDNGDGEASTLFMAGAEPAPLPNKDSKDGALAQTTTLGHN